MPSTDYRRKYNDVSLDICKRRGMNSDWSDDWVFTDSRLDLLYGQDEPFLKFLCETVHPAARPHTEDADAMVGEYNAHEAHRP